MRHRLSRRQHSVEEVDFDGFRSWSSPVGFHGDLGDSSDIFSSGGADTTVPGTGTDIFQSTQPAASPGHNYPDKFSDLWVRIEDTKTR